MSNTSNRMSSGGKKPALWKICFSFNLDLCQAGRERKSPAEYALYTEENSEVRQYSIFIFLGFVFFFLTFVLHISQFYHSLLPLLYYFGNLRWGLKHLRNFCLCKWSLTEHSILVAYRIIAGVSKLICPVVGGKISEHLRLLQYLPIHLPQPEILPPSKMLGVF